MGFVPKFERTIARSLCTPIPVACFRLLGIVIVFLPCKSDTSGSTSTEAVDTCRKPAMLEPSLLELAAIGIHKSNLLEGRVIIASYNQHVRLLSPGFGWFAPPEPTRGLEPTLSWNQLQNPVKRGC